MTRALRVSMSALVLLNLAFVYVTHSARWSWLAPLAILTITAPMLVDCTRYLWYRSAWSLALVGCFSWLVHHVVVSGTEYLLEDGLLLAALCQVLLLNNLSKRQKPDLLYFNSFLIAVVTSFLCMDLEFFALFVVYAIALVVSLQLLALSRTLESGEMEADSPQTGVAVRRCVRASIQQSAVVLLFTFVAFLFWPRDFQRQGFLSQKFGLQHATQLVGFVDEISLKPIDKAITSDEIVMRVHLQQGLPSEVSTYWRGATLDRWNGRDWTPSAQVVAIDPWTALSSGQWVRGTASRQVRLKVELQPNHAQRLFTPLSARRLTVAAPTNWWEVHPRDDLNFEHLPVQLSDEPYHYLVDVGPQPQDPDHVLNRLDSNLRTHLQVNPVTVPAKIFQWTELMLRKCKEGASQYDHVAKLQRLLAANYRYRAPGAQGAAQSLVEFLAGTPGHCEYFATTLALALRTASIPCRVVTGYRSDEWDDLGETLTIRTRHAHAWVEVLDPNRGWYAAEATPAGGRSAGGQEITWLASLNKWGASMWATVTAFDESTRKAALDWLRKLPMRLQNSLRHHPWRWLLIALIAATPLWYLRWQRRGKANPAARRYLKCLRSIGQAPLPGESPRETLARLLQRTLAPNHLQQLQEATVQHERERYR
jgi:transglutaminase-like putative cysteine protease